MLAVKFAIVMVEPGQCKTRGQSLNNVIRVDYQAGYGSEANGPDLPLLILLQVLGSWNSGEEFLMVVRLTPCLASCCSLGPPSRG
jgi:hypothetical protein